MLAGGQHLTRKPCHAVNAINGNLRFIVAYLYDQTAIAAVGIPLMIFQFIEASEFRVVRNRDIVENPDGNVYVRCRSYSHPH